MSGKIEIQRTMVLGDNGWISEYTVQGLGIEVKDSVLKRALTILQKRIYTALTRAIEDA